MVVKPMTSKYVVSKLEDALKERRTQWEEKGMNKPPIVRAHPFAAVAPLRALLSRTRGRIRSRSPSAAPRASGSTSVLDSRILMEPAMPLRM